MVAATWTSPGQGVGMRGSAAPGSHTVRAPFADGSFSQAENQPNQFSVFFARAVRVIRANLENHTYIGAARKVADSARSVTNAIERIETILNPHFDPRRGELRTTAMCAELTQNVISLRRGLALLEDRQTQQNGAGRLAALVSQQLNNPDQPLLATLYTRISEKVSERVRGQGVREYWKKACCQLVNAPTRESRSVTADQRQLARALHAITVAAIKQDTTAKQNEVIEKGLSRLVARCIKGSEEGRGNAIYHLRRDLKQKLAELSAPLNAFTAPITEEREREPLHSRLRKGFVAFLYSIEDKLRDIFSIRRLRGSMY